MPLTWLQAKETLARYAGTGGLCADNTQVETFTREVLDYLLMSGSYGNIHKFCFCVYKGCFTIPFELEVPLKMKVDGVIGTVWDKWMEFHTTKYLDNCTPMENAAYEDANYYPTVYPMPDGGALVGCLGFCNEDCEAHIIVQGKDPTGREIITDHKGQQIVGEYISIKKGVLVYTQNVFGDITGIIKSPTIGYVQLLWVLPVLNRKGFLADYSPLEERPSYRRFRLTTPCAKPYYKVSVLGRIRLKEKYTDTDYIPFNNLYALSLAGQAVNANFNQNPDRAMAADKQLVDIIERENEYKKVQNGQPMEYFLPLSGGAIGNIVNTNIFNGPGFRGWGKR